MCSEFFVVVYRFEIGFGVSRVAGCGAFCLEPGAAYGEEREQDYQYRQKQA